MAVQTSALSKLYISNASTTVSTQSAFEALTFVEVGEIEDMGEFGSEFSTINFTSLGDRLVRKFKGTEDPGTMTLQMGMDPDDTGQDMLNTALVFGAVPTGSTSAAFPAPMGVARKPDTAIASPEEPGSRSAISSSS